MRRRRVLLLLLQLFQMIPVFCGSGSHSRTGSFSISKFTMFGSKSSGLNKGGIMRHGRRNMDNMNNMNMESIIWSKRGSTTRKNNCNCSYNVPLMLFTSNANYRNNFNCPMMIKKEKPSLFHASTCTPRAPDLHHKKNGLCYSSRSSKSSNYHDNDGDNEEISFRWESLDRIGQWMTIDYDNIEIDRGKNDADTTCADTTYTDNNNNNNNNESTNNRDRKRTNKRHILKNVFAPVEPSPVETKLIQDRLVYIKRDDLLHLRNSNVSGNKARKMLALNELHAEDFPDVTVSYGGPQSNAMVALAAIVQSKNRELIERENQREHKHKRETSDMELESLFSSSSSNDSVDEIESDGWLLADRDGEYIQEEGGNYEYHGASSLPPQKRFVYYTKKLPRYLRNQPNGNLLRALSLGMELVQLNHGTYNDLFGGADGGSSVAPIDAPTPGKSLWVPQGGACGLASQGAILMAEEIVSFWAERGKGMPLSVCVPGGTCTTAMLLSREVNRLLKDGKDGKDGNHDEDVEKNPDIQVVVVPCVGDSGYARRQMKALDLSTGGNGIDDIPQILKRPRNKSYFRFGEPNADILKIFLQMKDEHGVYLDLLYGAPAWSVILEHWKHERYGDDSEDSPIKGRQLMYVHSGGLEGISSQLTRYKHKGLIDSGEVQS